MPFEAIRYRFLWRLRAPIGPEEVRRIERWLASARVFLAISALFTVWMDPAQMRSSPWAYWLLGFYIVHGVVIMLLLRMRQESTPSFRLFVHAGDIIWPALICMYNTGQATPFFLFFVFVLGAAAYRWGLWETAGTAVTAVALLWTESLLFHLGVAHWADRVLVGLRLPPLGVHVADFEPKRLFMRSIYLLVMGGLLGYLAEQQKKLRAEKAVIARSLGKVRVEAGMSATLQQVLGDLLTMYRAKLALIASSEADSKHTFLGEVRPKDNGGFAFQWLEVSSQDREVFLFESPADTCFITRRHEWVKAVALDEDGTRLRGTVRGLADRLGERYDFRSLVTADFVFGHDWWGRVFLLDAHLSADVDEELSFLKEFVHQVGPAVYNVYLLRRLRRRAGAMERARFARELHDGAVQSLIGVEMQVDVLRRQLPAKSDIVPDELGRIQGLLRDEVLKLRELMQQMKSLDVDSRRLAPFLADCVERFQRETGIQARFYSELQEPDMPQPVCRELARIVQEGLVNVRKHSQASQVEVRLGSKDGLWCVVIEDDGRGFPFAGRFSDGDLSKLGKGPVVIRERAHLVEGELTVESSPGKGARLEISVPQKREVARI